MSDVIRAIQNLEGIVTNLEGSLDHLESTLTGEQRDMFSSLPPANTNKTALDKQAAVDKIDSAIDMIEDILSEDDKREGGAHG